MFEKIQKKYMVKMILGAVLCWVIIAVLVAVNAEDISTLIRLRGEEPQDFNSLSAEQIKEGMYVKGEILTPVDYYAYWTEDGKTTSKEFLVPVGEKEYMGLSCDGTTMDSLDANMKTYWQALEQNDKTLVDSLTPVQVEGVIQKLSGESLGFFQQFISELQIDQEQKSLFLPYVIMEGRYGDIEISGLILQGIFVLILLLVSIYCIVGIVKRRNIKDLKKYCLAQGDLEYGLFQMEQFYEGGMPVQGLRLDDRFFLMVVGSTVHFIETSDIVWIYPNVTQHSYNFIPTGKTYAIKVKKRNGREVFISVKNKRAMDEVMQYIGSRIPYVILGYDKEIEKIYNRNRNEMIQEVDRRRQEHLGTVAQAMEQTVEQTDMVGEDRF